MVESDRRNSSASENSEADCGCGCGASVSIWSPAAHAGNIGYDSRELSQAPPEANLGLGCGNPQAFSKIKAGETVLDLGSGAGFDAFLAARAVGPAGRVIGVDMTPQMIVRARENLKQTAFQNIEFREGEIESLPVADSSVDVIISNCVINLSPEKERAFREMFRVLRPGGRLAIADIVLDDAGQKIEAAEVDWSGCVAGAERVSRLRQWMANIGFQCIEIRPIGGPAPEASESIVSGANKRAYYSASITAVKIRL